MSVRRHLRRRSTLPAWLLPLLALACGGGSGGNDPAPAPAAAVSDSTAPAGDHAVAFGDVTEGATSTETVTVTNGGTASLTVGAIAASNPLAAPFAIGTDGCSGQALAPASSCTVTVRFAPAGTGPFADAFDVPTNDPAAPVVTVGVSGTGAAVPVPVAVVTDAVAPPDDHAVPFGDVTEDTTTERTVTVTNGGTAGLVLGSVAAGDPLAPPFTIPSDGCSGHTLAPAASCAVTVRFSPAAAGPFADSFDIASDDPSAPSITVTVSGAGTAAPAPVITVTDPVAPGGDHALPFGDITLGTSSHLTLIVANTGTADLSLGAVAGADPLAAPFEISADGCSGQTLPPSATCAVTVRFAPTAAGPSTDGFDIPSDDPGTPAVTMAVSGAGVAGALVAATVPRTGQSTCYDAADDVAACAGTGQDGELQKGVAWPAPRFTVGAGAEADCVTDALTGLVWARSGDLQGAATTWQGALDFVAALNSGAGLCGHHDWRLPNKNELRSLANYGTFTLATWLNDPAQGFTNVRASPYWSSTTCALPAYTDTAWSVNVMDGYLLISGKVPSPSSHRVWPVRAGRSDAPAPVPRTGQTTCYTAAGGVTLCAGTGQDGDLRTGVAWPGSRFAENADTTIADRLTGLHWAPAANTPTFTGTTTCTGGAMSWHEALAYVACLNANAYLGHSDWRLPNVNELQSLANADDALGTWLGSQGFSGVQPIYWSSDTRIATPFVAWVVNLSMGMPAAGKSTSYHAWPVRGGP
jgi:hypothetical protein